MLMAHITWMQAKQVLVRSSVMKKARSSSRRAIICILVTVLEAELAACMEGIVLPYEWSTKLFIIETDYELAANMIHQLEIDRSPAASIIGKIKILPAQEKLYSIGTLRRPGNSVAYRLAQIG